MARLISGTCILASEDWPLSIEALSEGHFLNTANFGRVQGKCPFEPIIYKFFCVPLTPNRPLAHTSFTYRKLNMDGFSVLNGFLGYPDSTQKIF